MYAVEPALSPVILRGQPGSHPLQGNGAGLNPRNLHSEIQDTIVSLTKENYLDMPGDAHGRKVSLHAFHPVHRCRCGNNPGSSQRPEEYRLSDATRGTFFTGQRMVQMNCMIHEVES